MRRTHAAGLLREHHLEQQVAVCGWAAGVRDQAHQMFIDLRDREGVVQCVVDRDLHPEAHAVLKGIRPEYCLQLQGKVQVRPTGTANPALTTGALEVQVSQAEILNPSKTPPFEITDAIRADEALRIQYRYLDLRRAPMRDVLHLRHRVVKCVRDFLDSQGFWEVETPLLWKSTPEGAKEFMVPATTHPGKAFVLPQSPQLCKQMLMVGGIEKVLSDCEVLSR